MQNELKELLSFSNDETNLCKEAKAFRGSKTLELIRKRKIRVGEKIILIAVKVYDVIYLLNIFYGPSNESEQLPSRHLLVQSWQWGQKNNMRDLYKLIRLKNNVIDLVLEYLLLTVDRFCALF